MSEAATCPTCGRPGTQTGLCQACKADRKSKVQKYLAMAGTAAGAIGGAILWFITKLPRR
jgi:hypothetical protein